MTNGKIIPGTSHTFDQLEKDVNDALVSMLKSMMTHNKQKDVLTIKITAALRNQKMDNGKDVIIPELAYSVYYTQRLKYTIDGKLNCSYTIDKDAGGNNIIRPIDKMDMSDI